MGIIVPSLGIALTLLQNFHRRLEGRPGTNRSIACCQGHISALPFAGVRKKSIVRPLVGVTVLLARITCDEHYERGFCRSADSSLSLTSELLMQGSAAIQLSWHK